MATGQEISDASWAAGVAGVTGSIVVYCHTVDENGVITGNVNKFTEGSVGEQIYLEKPLDDDNKPWEVGKEVVIGDIRISSGNTYRAVTAGKTGATRPVHIQGVRWDGTPNSDPEATTGGVRWEYLHSGWGIAQITRYLTPYSVECVVVKRIPEEIGQGTTAWGDDVFGVEYGYAEFVKFHRERLTLVRGQRVWFSVVSDFRNFATKEGATLTPDMSIAIDITSDELNSPMWVKPSDSLIIGTEGSEVGVSEISTNEGFVSGNIKAVRRSGVGSRKVAPQLGGSLILFAQSSGRRIRALQQDGEAFTIGNMNVLNDDIINGQVTQLAFHNDPYSILWCVTYSGKLIALTYNTEQEVTGWHVHPTNNKCRSVAVIPNPFFPEDQLWAVFEKVKDGVTTYTLEYLDVEFNGDYLSLTDSRFLDSSIRYDGRNKTLSNTVTLSAMTAGNTGLAIFVNDVTFAVGDWLIVEGWRYEVMSFSSAKSYTVKSLDIDTTGLVSPYWSRAVDSIAGAEHLANETVQCTVDGGIHPDVTVSATGTVSFDTLYSVITLGYAVQSEWVGNNIEAGSDSGTAQDKVKRVHKISVNLLDTLGGQVGVDGVMMEDIDYRTPEMVMNSPPTLFTGMKEVEMGTGFEKQLRLKFTHNDALPCTVLALIPQLDTQSDEP